MALDLVQRYNAPDLAVQVDSGARAILPGTNISFSVDPITGAITINGIGGAGTVTSVGATGSTGLTVGGSPITTAGVLTFTLSANLQGWSGIAPGTLGNYVLKAGDTMTGQLFMNTTAIPLRMRSPTTTNGSANFDIGQNTSGVAGDNNGFVVARVGGIDFYTANTARGQMTAAGDLNWSSTITAAGTVTSGQTFQSGSVNVVLATTGAGGIFLRPNGAGSATGQTTINSGGLMTVGGGVSASGNIIANVGDMYSYRTGGTTGVIFLTSGATRYLYYNGTSYEMPSAVLNLDTGVQLGTGGKLLSKISLGTAAPGALANGELYLRY